MINCILENSSEYIKYQLATSQVLLGITPTIICLLGASSEEVCLLALIGRRRFLGFLLSAASPSIYTERAFKYQDADQIMKDLDDVHVKTTVIAKPRWLFVLLEYLAVFAAISNIAILNWQLGLKSVNSLNANTIYMPMLWSFFGICAHGLGAVVFQMRARRSDDSGTEIQRVPTLRSFPTLKFSDYLPKVDTLVRELTWLPEDKRKKSTRRELESRYDHETEKHIYFTHIPETRTFTFLSWLLSVLIIFHIILGTLILSSTNFVGPKDALGIMARYILSVVICRIILVYELAVLGMKFKPMKQSGAQEKE
jgi:hypothetical protein